VIAAACGNRVLVDVLARLARAAAVSRFVTSDSPRVRARAVRDLESLVSAVGRRRGEDARRAMQRHLGRLAGPAGEAPPSS
jgi:DNA-binding GntR family transcriptional regulator